MLIVLKWRVQLFSRVLVIAPKRSSRHSRSIQRHQEARKCGPCDDRLTRLSVISHSVRAVRNPEAESFRFLEAESSRENDEAIRDSVERDSIQRFFDPATRDLALFVQYEYRALCYEKRINRGTSG
jgi:hypothetical protein